jgi:hypothetical protein
MSSFRPRRRVAAAGSAVLLGLTGGLLATVLPGASAASQGTSTASTDLPVKQIEKALQVEGTVSDGVLQMTVERSDLHVEGMGVPFKTGFEIAGDVALQSLGHGRAILNGDMALKDSEIQPVIDALLAHHLVFQSEHQHFYFLKPMVWFVHYRGTGDPVALAKNVHAVLEHTSTPLPQKLPSHPTTPLPAATLGHILGGAADVGENGVVTVTVPRAGRIELGGVRIKPGLNVSTTVEFEPLGSSGRAAVSPDMSMTAGEVNPVVRTLRSTKWVSGCLYNQEIQENPQLFFDHFFKVGDAVTLAHEIRKALDKTNVKHG